MDISSYDPNLLNTNEWFPLMIGGMPEWIGAPMVWEFDGSYHRGVIYDFDDRGMALIMDSDGPRSNPGGWVLDLDHPHGFIYALVWHNQSYPVPLGMFEGLIRRYRNLQTTSEDKLYLATRIREATQRIP